jgi:hypothetical protein
MSEKKLIKSFQNMNVSTPSVKDSFDYENENPVHPDEKEWWDFKPATLDGKKCKLSKKLGIVIFYENKYWILLGQQKNNKVILAKKLPHHILLFIDMCGIVTPLNEFYDKLYKGENPQ